MTKMSTTTRWLKLGRTLEDVLAECRDPQDRVALLRVFRRAGIEPPAVMPIEEFDDMMNLAPCPFRECIES